MAVDLLGGVLDDASGAGERVALVAAGRPTRTLAELDRAVDERAERLAAEGVSEGRVHTLVADQSVDGVVELLAAWRLGATAAPLNPRLTEAERTAAEAALRGRESTAQAVLWTSGTSGRPRGVEITYDNLRASADAVVTRLSLTRSDVWLATLSPAHIGGLALITRALLVGCPLVLAGAFDAGLASRLIDEGDALTGVGKAVTHVSLVPVQLRRLLDQREGRAPAEGFRCALIGGAHAPDDLVRRALDAGWPLALTYGMTEMTSQVATAPPRLVVSKPGTVGGPLDGVRIRIGEDGEILASGPTRAAGYAGPDAGALADGEGWYHTGDLGHIDDDGDLWITGRRSDRIVTGGVSVDAIEVEELVRSHPSVVDVCVVGVPDEEWGERVAAWVVPVEGEFDLEVLQAWLAGRVGSAKRPRHWVVDHELPLNTNGKVDRARVRRAMS